MFRINRKTDYAIRVVLALAKQGDDALLSTAQIQKEMLIPKSLAGRLVAELAKGGFLITFPGRDGGLKLSRPAAEINLRQVIELMEGEMLISECLHGRGTCPFDERCPVRTRWGRLQALIVRELEQTTFEELAREAILSAAEVIPLQVEQV
ncbi:MAG: Rrf2 family transcriptional regulator [Anaerolineales bacterium]